MSAMGYELQSARHLAADVLKSLVQPGDRAVDATMGNGHDTCLLAELVGEAGHVDAFDLQPQAVANTRARLTQAGLVDRCSLHLLGHEHLGEVVTAPIRAAVFNLGWLPGGNKSLTTRWETTEAAILAAMALLMPGGACIVSMYPGHGEGDRERKSLLALAATLRPQVYTVLHQKFINAGHGAPENLVIQRNRA